MFQYQQQQPEISQQYYRSPLQIKQQITPNYIPIQQQFSSPQLPKIQQQYQLGQFDHPNNNFGHSKLFQDKPIYTKPIVLNNQFTGNTGYILSKSPDNRQTNFIDKQSVNPLFRSQQKIFSNPPPYQDGLLSQGSSKILTEEDRNFLIQDTLKRYGKVDVQTKQSETVSNIRKNYKQKYQYSKPKLDNFQSPYLNEYVMDDELDKNNKIPNQQQQLNNCFNEESLKMSRTEFSPIKSQNFEKNANYYDDEAISSALLFNKDENNFQDFKQQEPKYTPPQQIQQQQQQFEEFKEIQLDSIQDQQKVISQKVDIALKQNQSDVQRPPSKQLNKIFQALIALLISYLLFELIK